ncbi:adhesion G protein-coupled receptor G3 isoform X2 [Equus caballus]|uniref:adhesion G protein-coupled receptor G3 isoform X2 n=1 Tax=Equus caballus TaxID=9796 RepID=UPI0038B2E581
MRLWGWGAERSGRAWDKRDARLQGSGQRGQGWPRMVTPRALGVLLLRLLLPLASGKVTEQPRNVCLGLPKMNTYDHFGLNDTAKCFTECGQQGSKPCKLETLQRYWLNYEIHLVEESVTDTVNMSFLKSFVKDISTNISEDLHFSLTPFQIPTQMTDDGHEHPDRVRLPRTLFKSLQGSRSMVRLAITVLNVGPGNLFKNVTLSCVFWDANKGSTGDWSSKGCSTELRAKETVCRCDHLTFFALLLRPVLDNVTVQALKYISQAGCGASMFFLAFTIALYAALRFYWQRLKSEDAPKIHVALSISLFLLNLVFFINMGVGRRASEAACRAHGAVFHYFLLCTFTWMGLEAFHLYLLIIRVFNTYFGHYFLKLSLVGWGLPALIVFGNGIAKSYGLYAIHDKENTTTLELCWFYEKTALYVTVHGYFLVTFLFSAVVLGLVAWKIFTLSNATVGKMQGLNWKGVLTVLGLSSLLGMTWGLVIFTPLGLSATYVFALFNSLQGIFIFCWFVILYFPRQSTTSSTSGTARADQAHSVSHE